MGSPSVILFNLMVEHKSRRGRRDDARLDQVYGAIADPTRRAILSVLASGEVNVSTLADRFPMSFNGVSKHVKVLERAALLQRTIRGREHRLRLTPAPLREAARWIEHHRAFWETRLDALERLLVERHQPAASLRPRRAGRHRE
jgi:DNA-binding transcriptional ArsR family regulator